MNVSGKLESHIFRRLVLVYSIQYLALSLTGIFAAEQDRKALLNERHDIIRFCLIGCTITAAVLILAALAVHQIVLALGFGGWLIARKLSTKYGWYGMESCTRAVAEVHRMIETMDQVTDASREVIALCKSYGVDKKEQPISGCVSRNWRPTVWSTDSGTANRTIWTSGLPSGRNGSSCGCADDVSYSHALDLNNVCIRIAR